MQNNEIKAEQDADTSIGILESLSTNSSKTTIDSAFLEAQTKTGLVADVDKQASYLNRIGAVQKTSEISGSN